MIVFEKPHALTDTVLHYCPGCTHGIVHRLVAEAIDELGIEGKTVGIALCDKGKRLCVDCRDLGTDILAAGGPIRRIREVAAIVGEVGRDDKQRLVVH